MKKLLLCAIFALFMFYPSCANASLYNEYCQNIVINAAFSENFNSKYYKAGDMVEFTIQDDIKTDEGKIIIPKNSTIIGAVRNIEKPKWVSRNAKVSIDFMYILTPNKKRLTNEIELADTKGYLSAGPKAITGKIVSHTLGVGGFGAGLGAAIGTASTNTIPGLIIGGSIGGGVGIITGIVSPGLHYKVKKGYIVPVRLNKGIDALNL